MIADASKSGVAQEAAQNIRRATKIMAEPEARQVLGVTEHSSWEEILKVALHFIYAIDLCLRDCSIESFCGCYLAAY